MNFNGFILKVLKPFTPGANPMQEDFENMGTSLGSNVMVLHKSFPGDEMTWMVLVHIPTGKRIKIMFPEEAERSLSPEEAMDILSGHDTGIGSNREAAFPTSVMGDEELRESLNALIDLGVQTKLIEMGVDPPTSYCKTGGTSDDTR